MPDEIMSAVPENLDHFVRTAVAIADELTVTAGPLLEDLQAFEADARRVSVPLDLPDVGAASTGSRRRCGATPSGWPSSTRP